MEGRKAALLFTPVFMDLFLRPSNLPFASSVSATGREHELRNVLVDLAPSKSKSSSIGSGSGPYSKTQA